MVWGRDGFIGSQRYPMQWGGDPQTDWEAMAASIRAGWGYGMSGVPYYATDVGGFYGTTQPDAELSLALDRQCDLLLALSLSRHRRA